MLSITSIPMLSNEIRYGTWQYSTENRNPSFNHIFPTLISQWGGGCCGAGKFLTKWLGSMLHWNEGKHFLCKSKTKNKKQKQKQKQKQKHPKCTNIFSLIVGFPSEFNLFLIKCSMSYVFNTHRWQNYEGRTFKPWCWIN